MRSVCFGPRNAIIFALLTLAVAFAATRAHAHAVLENSRPENDSVVTGPDVPILLSFNVRIDAERSRLRLFFPNATIIDLSPEQIAPNTLQTKATGLAPGPYTILWQVLAPDGHISRGEIPFKVAAAR